MRDREGSRAKARLPLRWEGDPGGAVSPMDQSAPAPRVEACCLVRGPAVEALGIAIADGVLVFLGKPLIFVELFQFGFAGIVVDLVGKIRGEDKRLVADDADGEGQGELIAFDPDVNPVLVDVAVDVIRY